MAQSGIIYFIYNVIVLIAAIFAVPYFICRNLWLKRPIKPYFINITNQESLFLKDKNVIWVQAVSVGETVLAEVIIRKLKNLWPDYQIVFTTTTPTGFCVAKQKLADLAMVTYFPLEIPFFMRSFITKIHPILFITMESELWPNAIRYCKESGAKIALVNGRISNRSFKNYRRLSAYVKNIFQQIDLFAMQSIEDANRIGMVGAPLERIMVTGNVKFDQGYPEYPAQQLIDFKNQYRFKTGIPIFTAASTHRGEEEIVIETFLNLCKDEPYYLIIAPRHPDRAEEVGMLLQKANLSYLKRSSGEPIGNPDCKVLLFDTLGELGLAYAVSDAVFVGGSLIKLKGIAGHNILEAAVQQKPVLYGPYMDNFRESKRLLEEADAGFTIRDSIELAEKIRYLLTDRTLYQKRALQARNAVLLNKGAAEKTIHFIGDLLRRDL